MFACQAVVMGEKVYVGGGNAWDDTEGYNVFQYNTSRQEWSRLPPHSVIAFTLAQFMGSLITVGGEGEYGCVDITGKVYRFKEESQEWEEFLEPMPTARFLPNVATTQSAIIASGGVTGERDEKYVPCATVEVYCSGTSQWYTADPLPAPRYLMTCQHLVPNGGADADNEEATTVLYASVTSLIQKATSPTHQSASCTSVWKTLPDTPLKESTAASLSGNLLAVGGLEDESTNTSSSAVHVFFPHFNSWVRIVTGDLPQPRAGCTAVQLSSNTMIVIGGEDHHVKYKDTKTVFIGTVTV